MGVCLGLKGCGTVDGYNKARCRGEKCSTVKANYIRGRRPILKPIMVRIGPRRADIVCPVLCQFCRRPIEKCDGKFGDWMHTVDRRELCGPDRLAEPELPEQVGKVSA